MDDQFGGRTDDDLFFDDFEPVVSEAQPTRDEQPPRDDAPNGFEALRAVANGQSQANIQEEIASKPSSRSLANSRHNPERIQSRTTRQAPSDSAAKTTAAVVPSSLKDRPSNQASVNSDSRIGSGANPRQKLTEQELAAKMEKMRILNAEKARKFEQEEKDEREHAQAYARGMEEQRKKRQAETEKRRQGEEDRKRMEDERAKNRERKLKAIGMKEGGWDEGKDVLLEEESRRAFRGANGGIRGAKTATGLAGSRYAQVDDDVVDTTGSEARNRGRGRGRGGRGSRGGRGGFGGDRDGIHGNLEIAQSGGSGQTRPSNKAPLKSEDFPELPSSGAKKSDTGPVPTPPKVSIPTKSVAEVLASTSPLSPPVGDWGDEMEALDAKLAQKKS